jgi:hypothetical protein
MERSMWYNAYNKLSADEDGVSLGDFMMGDAVMKTIMFR